MTAPDGSVTCARDAVRMVEGDPRLAEWSLALDSDHYMEIRRGQVFLVLSWPQDWLGQKTLEYHLVRARSGNYSLLLFGSDEQFAEIEPAELDTPGLWLCPAPVGQTRFVTTIASARTAGRNSRWAAYLELALEQARHANDMLISVGRALSQQRNLRSLLAMILRRAREATGADAGSIYVVEGTDEDVAGQKLRFTVSQNDSVDIESREFTIAVTASSIVGSCVIEGRPIDIQDLYRNPQGYIHDRSFDEKHGYQTRSVLTVPMISARKQVIGVIQLINKRARGYSKLEGPDDFAGGVIPFDYVSVNYAKSLASQAGIALENALLHDEVATLFEGFVHASVSAIEARDPTTSGHSERVAELTVGLAEVTDRVASGPYAGHRVSPIELKQIQYAALLHDFGKVGVREPVLVKAKKLYEHERDLILERFHFIRKTIENEVLAAKVAYLVESSRERTAADLAAHIADLEADMAERIAEIDEFVAFILSANEPTVLEQGGFERIGEIATRHYTDGRGENQPYLTPEEASALQILRGSLTREERTEIESHVVHTYEFLKKIPWGRTFRDVPTIAAGHHEKLDGSGYPNRLSAAAIPPATRMMTISDIYDALTASDRPYKRAMPAERALDILASDVKRGLLDGDLFDLFVTAKIYERAARRR